MYKRLLFCVLAPFLFGCAEQFAQKGLRERCEKDGKQVFLVQTSSTILYAAAEGVCVGPSDIAHLPASFGADAVASRISTRSGIGLYFVTSESVAARAGLKAADFIYEFGGRPIVSATDLSSAIESTAPGKEVLIKFRRENEPLTATARF